MAEPLKHRDFAGLLHWFREQARQYGEMARQCDTRGYGSSRTATAYRAAAQTWEDAASLLAYVTGLDIEETFADLDRILAANRRRIIEIALAAAFEAQEVAPRG